MATWKNVLEDYEKPCVFILIKYTQGLDGSNILILKEHDVKIITDLMMGGDGSNTDGELGELHLSAISEAMNQMMGSSATSLSTMLGKMIDISPPNANLLDLTDYAEDRYVVHLELLRIEDADYPAGGEVIDAYTDIVRARRKTDLACALETKRFDGIGY